MSVPSGPVTTMPEVASSAITTNMYIVVVTCIGALEVVVLVTGAWVLPSMAVTARVARPAVLSPACDCGC